MANNYNNFYQMDAYLYSTVNQLFVIVASSVQ